MASLTRAYAAVTDEAFHDKLARLQASLGTAGVPEGLLRVRERALRALPFLGFPQRKQESWKYSSLTHLKALDLTKPASIGVLPEGALRDLIPAGAVAFVFVNGRLSLAHSKLGTLAAAGGSFRVYGSWEAPTEFQSGGPEALDVFFEENLTCWPEDDYFAALAGAFLSCALAIEIPAATRLSGPLCLLSIATEDSAAAGQTGLTGPACWLRVGAGSRVAILERHVSLGHAPGLNASLTRWSLAENSRVESLFWQDQNEVSHDFSYVTSGVGAGAELNALSVAAGARFSRQNLKVHVQGEGASVRLNGLYMVHGERQSDTLTEIHHHSPHGSSHQLYKGVLNDRARAVFSGKIRIHPQAQKIDSSQLNKNLLLSSEAEVDTKPQLEIFADDVKATHGATVGQLQEEELFYMMSRAIPRSQAVQMVARGYIEDVFNSGPEGVLREAARGYLNRYFADGPGARLLSGIQSSGKA